MTTAPAARPSLWRNGAKLTAVTALAALVLAGPAWALAGPLGLEGLLYAAVLCLTPGWLVFTFQSLYGAATPVAAVVVGMVGRLAIVMLGALAAKAARPELGVKSFALWLGAMYLVTLATETKLLLAKPLLSPPSRGPSPDA